MAQVKYKPTIKRALFLSSGVPQMKSNISFFPRSIGSGTIFGVSIRQRNMDQYFSNTVGVYFSGNSPVLKDTSKHVLPTAPSPTTQRYQLQKKPLKYLQ